MERKREGEWERGRERKGQRNEGVGMVTQTSKCREYNKC